MDPRASRGLMSRSQRGILTLNRLDPPAAFQSRKFALLPSPGARSTSGIPWRVSDGTRTRDRLDHNTVRHSDAHIRAA
jgi:hypothetical protein